MLEAERKKKEVRSLSRYSFRFFLNLVFFFSSSHTVTWQRDGLEIRGDPQLVQLSDSYPAARRREKILSVSVIKGEKNKSHETRFDIRFSCFSLPPLFPLSSCFLSFLFSCSLTVALSSLSFFLCSVLIYRILR